MAMLIVRARRFLQRTGRNLRANGPTSMGFDMSKVECYNCHRKGHFARECRSPKDTRRNGVAEPQKRNVPVETSTSNALVSQCDGVGSYDWSFQAEKEPTNYALMAFSSLSYFSDNEVVSYSKACTKAYAQLQSHYDNLTADFRKSQFDVISYQTCLESVKARLLVYQQNEYVFKEDIKLLKLEVQLRDNALVSLRQNLEIAEQERDDLKHNRSAPIIEDWVFDLEDESETKAPQNVPSFVQPTEQVKSPRPSNEHVKTSIPAATPKPASPKPTNNGKHRNRKACFVCKSLDHLTKACNYHEKKISQPTARNHAQRGTHKQYAQMTLSNPQRHVVFVAVLTQSKLVPINVVRPVSTIVSKIKVTRQRQYKPIVTKPNSPTRRHVNRKMGMETKMPNFRPCFPQHKCINDPKKGNPQYALKDKGVIDSGCSRHMTGNMSYLFDFEKLNGGYVAFRGNPKGGKISRKGKTLFEATRTMLADSLLPIPFWAEAVNTASYVKNRALVTKPHSKTLMNFYMVEHQEPEFKGRKPESEVDVSPSSSAQPKKHDYKTKREAKGKSPVESFTGYRNLSAEFKGFFNNIINKDNAAATLVLAVRQISPNSTNTFSVAGSLNAATSPTHGKFSYDVGVEADFNNLETSITVSLIPTIRAHKDHPVTKIIGDLSSATQTRSMTRVAKDQVRLSQINNKDFHTYFPYGKRAIGTKWVFRNKKDERGIVVRNKARLVAQGHTQDEGIDYEEVFAPVARIEAIRLFLAYASFMGFMMYQMEAKSSFLYGTIEEEVYVYQPPGFEDPDYPDKVYKVVKALYGLHQVLRTCHDKYVAEIIRKFGLTDRKSASTLIDTKKPLLKDHDVKRIFRYLKGKLHLGLWYPKDSPFDLVAYLDSDYAGATLDRKSTTGGCQFLGCRLISWQCKKQTVVATSSTEAEYVAAASCCSQVLWIQNQLLDYGPDQTVSGKDSSNSLMADNLPKIVWSCYSNEDLASPKQTALGVNTPRCDQDRLELMELMIFLLPKVEKFRVEVSVVDLQVSAARLILLLKGFNQIIDFLNRTLIKYALTVNPNIYVSCIKQFWTTVAVKKVNDVTRLQALVDKKKVVVTEATIRDALCLDDAKGVECLPIKEIFAKLARMGYEKPSTKLTFYKAFFSSQWKFLIHTILHCMSAKRTLWNEFNSLMASAVICLSSGRKINFFNFIRHVAEGDVDEVHGKDVNATSVVTEGVVNAADDVVPTDARISMNLFQELMDTRTTLTRRVEHLEFDKIAQALEITKLKQRVKKLKRRNKLKVLKLRRLKRVRSAQRINTSDDTVMDDVSKHGGIIENIDADEDVVLEDAKDVAVEKSTDVEDNANIKGRTAESQVEIYKIDLDYANKVLSMQEEESKPIELQEVVDVVTIAKIITEVVTTASTTITVVDVPIPTATTAAAPIHTAAPSRRTKGVVIRDPKESTTTSIIIHSETKSKDKELEAELNRTIDWDEVIDHVNKKAKEDNDVKRYQAIKRKPQTEAQARKNMMVYLKNVACFKMDYFKRMSYDDIRLIFGKYFDSNVDFLQKTKELMDEEDSRALKRLNESKEEKAAKKQKLEEEVEELKRHLQIVPNDEDDVYTEDTLLARKVPVVDYEIYNENNKPYYKIKRANGLHQLYLSFLSILRNFDREDLRVLWSLVKERFATTKLENFSDDFLLITLRAMFEKPYIHAQI
nr:putative ribonuclease H-like domain-containing protein [Tanacetum cinerariifolium]